MPKILLSVVVFLSCTQALNAERLEDEGFFDSPVGIILLGEGMFAANSYIASLDPKAYGITSALVFPFALFKKGRPNRPIHWIGLFAAEAMAAHNITHFKNATHSRTEIFQENYVGWHLFAALLFGTGLVAPGNDSTLRYLLLTQPTQYTIRVQIEF